MVRLMLALLPPMLFLLLSCARSLTLPRRRPSPLLVKLFVSNDCNLLIHKTTRRISPLCGLIRTHPRSRFLQHSLVSTAETSAVASLSEEEETTTASELENSAPQKASWLIVGDGDLSFSARLASDITVDPSIRLTATVLEDETTHNSVYRNSRLHTQSIVEQSSQTVLFGVDATKLETRFSSEAFDLIIFNFPHWKGKANNRYNRRLIDDFLRSARNVLKEQGEIQMALCHGQGGADASNTREWRMSWMAPMYAAQHGLLLQRLEDFHPGMYNYDLSSWRGTDRPFAVGKKPLKYVFARPDGQATDAELQIAFRHELRIVLDPDKILNCGYSREILIHSDLISNLVRQVTPVGFGCQLPLRDVIVTKKRRTPILIFLVVYTGERLPLTRTVAGQIRGAVEQAVMDRLGLDIAKKGLMVSKPFPYSILDSLIEERE